MAAARLPRRRPPPSDRGQFHVNGRAGKNSQFWLGDTWWKGLAKRLPWEGFQELTADRKAKGFSVVQIACGRYPDEAGFQPRWENEGGKPFLTPDFAVINLPYSPAPRKGS